LVTYVANMRATPSSKLIITVIGGNILIMLLRIKEVKSFKLY